MRTGDFVEKRRTKRLNLSFPASIKGLSGDGKETVHEGVTINISFNGAYITDIDLENIQDKEDLKISISVPRDDTRDFPFSRLIGKARVVRKDGDGIAVEFDDDMSRLFVAN